MPIKVIDHVHRIAHRAPVVIAFADRNNVAFPDISDNDEVVDVSDSDSDNSDNDDDPDEAAYAEAADPEDSVGITGLDDQEYEHAGVVTREPTFRSDQSTKHPHTSLHTYAKTYQNIQEKITTLHQMANRPVN